MTPSKHQPHIESPTPISRRRFALVTVVAFLLVSSVCGYLDMLPESPQVAADEERSMPVPLDSHISLETSPVIAPEVMSAEAPERTDPAHAVIAEDTTIRRVVVNSIGLNAPILSPQSTNIDVLDAALLKGAVHYPTSAGLGEVGNMLLFGHSSSLPVIHNQNFKLFNRLSELSEGDVVRVESKTHEYVYRVESVRMVKAGEEMVRFDTREKRLTLVTCNNSFGDKTDRYVVEASFVGKYAL